MYIKYFLFYVFMMFKNHDFTLIDLGELKSVADWQYYLWLFLSLPTMNAILFSAPIYYSVKQKRPWILILVVVTTFVIEYFLYTYLASQSDLMNGVYNGIISLLLFFIFFYRHIVLMFDQTSK